MRLRPTPRPALVPSGIIVAIQRSNARAALMRWARESAGVDAAAAAKRAGVTPERIRAWEDPYDEDRPTFHQLRSLARLYHRPLAVFYLPEPPEDFRPMVRDYRRPHQADAGAESPQLIFEIRLAEYRREVALDLLEELEDEPPAFALKAAVNEEPGVVAARLRRALGVSLGEQLGWSSKYDALHRWRGAVEELGVLVFQTTRVEVAEMRGFSLAHDTLPVVAVNGGDDPHGRIFSLFHEMTHLLLRRSGLCDMRNRTDSMAGARTEVFANAVAGSALVPEASFRQAVAGIADDEYSMATLRLLGSAYSVSRHVIARRLLDVGFVDADYYGRVHELLRREQRPKKIGGGGPLPDVAAIARAGLPFTRTVLEGYHREILGAGDVAEYLGVKLKWLANIEARASTAEVGAL